VGGDELLAPPARNRRQRHSAGLKDKTTFDAKFSTIKPNKADGTLEGGNETRFIIERMCSDYGPSDEKKCSVSDRYERGGSYRQDKPGSISCRSTGSPFVATVCATRRPTSRLRSLLASSNPETSRRMLQMKISTFVSRSGLSRALAAAARHRHRRPAGAAKTPLADQPILVADVPANVLLTMSVEFPTAMNRAFRAALTATAAAPYLGYFDPYKCYEYVGGADGYFRPISKAGSNYTCSGRGAATSSTGPRCRARTSSAGRSRRQSQHRHAEVIHRRRCRADHPRAGLRGAAG
jgi:hypothetical protein